MRNLLQNFLGKSDISKTRIAESVSDEKSWKLAACILLLEIADSDNHFSEVEKQTIRSILRSEFSLKDDQLNMLIYKSESARSDAIDIWRFTNQLNQLLNQEEKELFMRYVWRVIYADGKLDQHEDYLAHKIAKLLRLKHREMIAAKLDIKKSLGIKD
ncbi:TerB family tellurite resistance protein [bacterium]|nr:TerB family tellurite resistance protein [candidate division CSSED10-310 bacterium]